MKVQTKIIHLLIIIFSTLLILISARKTSHDNSKKLGLVKRNSPSRGWRKPNIRSLQNRLQSRQVTVSEGSPFSQLSPPATAAKAPSSPSSNKPPPPPPAPKSPAPPPPAPKKAPSPPPPAPKKAPPLPPAPKKAPPSSPSSTESVFPSPTTTSSSLPLSKTPKVTLSSSSAIAGSPSSIIRSATTSFYLTLLVQLVVLLFYV
ncbi:unnamed protein product [Rhizophagus irregularis]|nr:unnamed protein product [Rhizophagus irregularis]CAB5372498.1 unnamed protein product [Rhizophagus irregularis]